MFDPDLSAGYIKVFLTVFAAPFPIMYVLWMTKKYIFE